MPQNNKEIIDEFKNKFVCVDSDCDQNGCIAVRVSENDWEPQQCQFCYEVRFPLIKLFEDKLEQVRSQTLAEVEEKIEGMMFVQPEQGGQFALHNSGYNQAIEELKEELLSLKQKSEEEKSK